jgi:hypothetical protein
VSENNGAKFTKTQAAMLAVLADGRPHPRRALHDCLPDELGDQGNIHRHISAIRKVIRPLGEDVLCVLVNRQIHYRQVRLLASPYKG